MSEGQITPEAARQIAQGILRSETPPPNADPKVKAALEALSAHQAERALEIVVGNVPPFGLNDAIETLTENLGEEDLETGQKEKPKGGEGADRFAQSEKTVRAIGSYLENPKNEPPQELLDMVYSYLATQPAFRELIVDSSGNVRSDAKEIAITLLRQPQVREKIMELYTQRLGPGRRLSSEIEIVRLEEEIRGIRDELSEGVDKLIRDKKQEITTLEGNIQSNERYYEYLRVQNEYLRLKEQFDELHKRGLQLEDLRQRITQAEGELAKFLNNRDNSQLLTDITRLDQARKELEELEGKRKDIDPERRIQLNAYLAEKQAQLSEKRSLLLVEQIGFASEIQRIVPEALNDYLNEAFTLAREKFNQAAQEEVRKKEEANKVALPLIIDKIVSRLGRKMRVKDGAIMYLPDRKEAKRLLYQLLLPDGAEKLFAEGSGKLRLDRQYLMGTYGLSDGEAIIFIEAVKSDPQYRRQLASQVAQGVLADYLLTGGRLSKDVVIAVNSTNWGNDLLTKGLELLQTRREHLEQLFGKGIISQIDEIKSKSSEWIKNNWMKVGLAIILILIIFGILGGKAARV